MSDKVSTLVTMGWLTLDGDRTNRWIVNPTIYRQFAERPEREKHERQVVRELIDHSATLRRNQKRDERDCARDGNEAMVGSEEFRDKRDCACEAKNKNREKNIMPRVRNHVYHVFDQPDREGAGEGSSLGDGVGGPAEEVYPPNHASGENQLQDGPNDGSVRSAAANDDDNERDPEFTTAWLDNYRSRRSAR
jgi:hypothetical protein